MQAKLKRAIWASLAGFAFAGVALVATQMATLAGTLLASHQAFAAAAAAKSLLQPPALRAEAPTGFSLTERRNIENAIRLQIRAYAARDAKQAFAKLAPSTQRFFGEPDRFLARWRRTCRPCSIRGASPFSAWSRSASAPCSKC